METPLSAIPPPEGSTQGPRNRIRQMKDEKTIQTRLLEMRGQFLSWEVPDVRVFNTTKDELRGWVHALEWVLGKAGPDAKRS